MVSFRLTDHLKEIALGRTPLEHRAFRYDDGCLQGALGVRRCHQLWFLGLRMASVFELLEEIEKQPGIFLGWSTAERGEQLRDLETLLIGYGHAVERHGIDDAGATFMQSFGVFLRERYGWSAAIGPIGRFGTTP